MLKILSSKYLKFVTGHYNVLLLCLSLLFIFRPHDNASFYLGIWKFFLTGTVLAAIFSCKHSKTVRLIEIILAIPTVLLCWLDLWWAHPYLLVINTALSVLFTLLCATSIIHDILQQSKVSFETLKGAISAYFLVAIGFAYLFWLIEFLVPGTFSINQKTIPVFQYAEYVSEMLYFSFITLLTIGYGDIVPTKDAGQTAVVIEGIIGQFYVAILVARLVALYSLTSQLEFFKNNKK